MAKNTSRRGASRGGSKKQSRQVPGWVWLFTGVIGGLFVVEAMSVIIQVFFYKRTGKRVFKMAPIHHHFEQLGWSEPTVVIRFWIIALVLALVGLSTLKLR